MDLAGLFDSIGLAKVREFLSQGQGETVHPEFKTISKVPLTRDDRRNVAKALSGFANSGGGIVVWGIDARKNKEGVDAASERRSIAHLAKLVSDLNSLTGQLVSPIVDGVRHEMIPEEGDVGYAKSLIPQSQATPHMAKGGEDRYYKRAGDSFYRMEHFDLEDMFGRRPRPDLRFHATPTKQVRGPGDVRIGAVVGLQNAGRAVAKYPYLSMTVDSPFEFARYGLDGSGNTGLPRLPQSRYVASGRTQVFGGTSEVVVYPGAVLDVTLVRCSISTEADPSAIPDLVVEYELCCEGSSMTSDTYELPGSCFHSLRSS